MTATDCETIKVIETVTERKTLTEIVKETMTVKMAWKVTETVTLIKTYR